LSYQQERAKYGEESSTRRQSRSSNLAAACRKNTNVEENDRSHFGDLVTRITKHLKKGRHPHRRLGILQVRKRRPHGRNPATAKRSTSRPAKGCLPPAKELRKRLIDRVLQ